MADDPKSTPEETEAEEKSEFELGQEQLHSSYQECSSIQERFVKIANRIATKSPEAADVLRQVANNLLPLMSSVIEACGESFMSLDEQIGMLEEATAVASEGESEGLDDEDAVDFYRVLTADLRLIDQALVASDSGEQRTALEALRDMNKQMRDRVIDLSDLEEEELERLMNEPTKQGGEEEKEEEPIN